MRGTDRAALAVVFSCVLGVVGIAWGQSAPRPVRPVNFATAQTVTGPVTMTKVLTADGGVVTTSLTAQAIRAQSAELGALVVDGGTFLGTLEVAGATTFRTAPTGLARALPISLARASPLLLGLGLINAWQDLGTVTAAGAQEADTCAVTKAPAGLVLSTVETRCWVQAGGSVLVQVKTSAALTFPAGSYEVRVIR